MRSNIDKDTSSILLIPKKKDTSFYAKLVFIIHTLMTLLHVFLYTRAFKVCVRM